MNNIELSTIYLPILDEVYKEGAKVKKSHSGTPEG